MNYTLVLEDLEGNEFIQPSLVTKTSNVVSMVAEGLMENSYYFYSIIASNQFGSSNQSAPIEIGKCLYCVI